MRSSCVRLDKNRKLVCFRFRAAVRSQHPVKIVVDLDSRSSRQSLSHCQEIEDCLTTEYTATDDVKIIQDLLLFVSPNFSVTLPFPHHPPHPSHLPPLRPAWWHDRSILDACGTLSGSDAPPQGKILASTFAEACALGMQDNWSQVRYAASVANRSLLKALSAEDREAFYPRLLPRMCLNR